MSDPDPKLRLIDDEVQGTSEVVRLGRGDSRPAPPRGRTPAVPVETPERLPVIAKVAGGGRSVEPGVEAILDQEEAAVNIEQLWGGEGKRPARVPHGWFWLLALLLAGGIVWAVGMLLKGEMVAKAQQKEISEKEKKEAAATRTAIQLVERVEKVIGAYLSAKSVEEILPWVRHPERVGPLIEEEWSERPRTSAKFLRLGAFRPLTLEGKPFWLVRAIIEGERPRSLVLEQTDETEVKVDWESDVCHQPMAWERFISESPSRSALDFRVWVVPDSHYSYQFADSGRWRCFRLMTRGSDAHLFGYLLAGSEEEKTLTAFCYGNPGNTASAILRLRAPEGIEAKKGVVIEALVEPRWVHVENPAKNSP